MNDIAGVMEHITLTLTKVAVIAAVIFLIILLVYFSVKYRGKHIRDSIALQRTLQNEIDIHHDSKRTAAVNSTVRNATVTYSDLNKKVFLKIPTKQWWQFASKAEVAGEIKKKLESPGFQVFLRSQFCDYIFSTVKTEKNCFTITGEKQSY